MSLSKIRNYRAQAKGFDFVIVDLVDDHWRNGYSAALSYQRSPARVFGLAEFLEVADALTLPLEEKK